ncbi:MAG: VTT domain-containing protein [Ruminococcaceae bacterium]|nr:VTT domain-containing protein [Oscillospiraceae bacterium]
MTQKTKNALLLAAKVAVAAVILTVVILNYDTLTNLDVRAIVEGASSVYAAIAIILGIFFAKSLLFVIPASLIYLSVGMAFSPLTAILVSFAGISIEVIATYLLGLFLGGDTVNKLLSKSKNGQKLLKMDITNKFSVLFVARFTGLPIDFTSLFLGASKCNILKYYSASVLGIMPRVIVFTLLGDTVYELIPMDLLIKLIICAIPIVIVVFVVKYFVDRKKKNQTKED